MLSRSLSVKVAVLSGAALAVVFAIGITVLVQQVGQTIQTETRQLQTATTRGVADEIAAGLVGASRTAEGIVTALEALHAAGPVDRAAYSEVLRHFLERNPQLLGTWAGWEPNAMDGQDAMFVDQPGYDATGRFIPYWNRAGGSIALEPLRDYDNVELGAYYQVPKALDRAVAIDPYAYSMNGADMMMMSFGVPIKDGNTFLGTAGVDLSLADLNARLTEIKPFGTGHVSLITGSGLVVADPDVTAIGKPMNGADAAMTKLLAAVLTDGIADVEAPSVDGTMMRLIAIAINIGGTEDRWVVVSHVPVSTLEAAANQVRLSIIGLAALCVLVACAILFVLIRRMVGRPLNTMGATVDAMANGDYNVAVADTQRRDEIGKLARAVEVFRENGIKVGQMTDAETQASIMRAKERGDMMVALQAAFGEVVDAAISGDFSKRVHAQFPDAELNALAGSVNRLVETVDGGLMETGDVLAALANTDLSKRMQGDYRGAFAKLQADTNAVGDKLTAVVTQLRNTSRSLKTATGEILAGANDLSERTTKQAATIEETSAAMEQMASTVTDNARMAEDANTKVQLMAENATRSGAVMGEANDAMGRITASSSKISNIIGLIDDIAFQTNLLALNASVEAARAGDAGKGFAVVAVEVRRLAQSAASASAEVKALIEQSAIEVAGGSKLVSSAAEQLTAMRVAVEENSALMQNIARASREQAAAIDEVSVAVRTMDEMTQHNAALVEQTNAAIEQTEAQASELDRVVDIFVLTEQPAVAAPRMVAPAPARHAVDKVKAAARSYLSRGNAAISEDLNEF